MMNELRYSPKAKASPARDASSRGAYPFAMNWNEYFDYRDGNLFHSADRPISHFKNEHGRRMWRTRYAGKIAGSIGGAGYLQARACRRLHLVHRIIYEMHNGPIPEGMQIDHINGIRSDNRVDNLRLATGAENSRNQKLSKDNTSGFKGVSWHSTSGKWAAQIRINGKNKHLGLFSTAQEGHIAYCAASSKYYGEYARPA